VLLAFGVGGFVGALIGGRIADARPWRTLFGALLGAATLLLLVGFSARVPWLNTSSFNVGNTLGPALGAVPLTAGYDYTAPAFVGAVLVLVVLALGVASRAADRRAP
jgi:DHA1 family chloramphenicol resistance protein-like MFS transporter